MGRNVLDKTNASKTNESEAGNKTITNQQGPSSALGRGMAPPPSTSSMAPSTSTSGTSIREQDQRPLVRTRRPSPTKAKKGKKFNSVTEDSQHRLQQRVLVHFWKGGFNKSGQIRKKVIKGLIKILNSNSQGQPEVKAPLQHSWGKEHETKQCAIDMYAKEEAARKLLAEHNTPSNKRPPESPTGATPEAKASVHPSPGGTTQVRVDPSLRSTVSTGNPAQMPTLTSPTVATNSPGGSGDSKEVGGGTGQG